MTWRIARIIIGAILFTVLILGIAWLPKPASAAPSPKPCTIAAVGDIGKTSTSGKPTAALIRRMNPTAILGLGDLAYASGTSSEFETNFLRHFRPMLDKFYGTPGNHEHYTENAQGFRDSLANVGRFVHYGVTKCGWRILAIDTEKPHLDTAGHFILAQRRDPRFRNMPMAIFTHKPCMSNGTSHGNETGPIKPLCDVARQAQVSLILSGHDHSYERFAVMGSLRQFVAGTGGADLGGFADYAPGSQAQASKHGVLFLTLKPAGHYGWAFIDTSGRTLDKGVA